MARNVDLKILRGTKANMPVLSVGELYLATDENQLYIGSSLGNLTVLLNSTATPSGSVGGVSAPAHKAGDPGPAQPHKIVTYARLILGGTLYWVPLMK